MNGKDLKEKATCQVLCHIFSAGAVFDKEQAQCDLVERPWV